MGTVLTKKQVGLQGYSSWSLPTLDSGTRTTCGTVSHHAQGPPHRDALQHGPNGSQNGPRTSQVPPSQQARATRDSDSSVVARRQNISYKYGCHPLRFSRHPGLPTPPPVIHLNSQLTPTHIFQSLPTWRVPSRPRVNQRVEKPRASSSPLRQRVSRRRSQAASRSPIAIGLVSSNAFSPPHLRVSRKCIPRCLSECQL